MSDNIEIDLVHVDNGLPTRQSLSHEVAEDLRFDIQSVLNDYCSGNRVVRYNELREHLSQYGLSLTEERFLNLLDANTGFIFEEGVDKEGAFWVAESILSTIAENMGMSMGDPDPLAQGSPRLLGPFGFKDGRSVFFDPESGQYYDRSGSRTADQGKGIREDATVDVNKLVEQWVATMPLTAVAKQLEAYAASRPQESAKIMLAGKQAIQSVARKLQ